MTVTWNCMWQYEEAAELLIGMQHRNYYFSRMILWFFPHSFNFQFTNVQFIQFMEDWKKFLVEWILIFCLCLVSHTRQHLLASHLHFVLYAVLMPTFENTSNKIRQKTHVSICASGRWQARREELFFRNTRKSAEWGWQRDRPTDIRTNRKTAQSASQPAMLDIEY